MAAQEELIDFIKVEYPDLHEHLESLHVPDGWAPIADKLAELLASLNRDECRACKKKAVTKQCSVCKVSRYCDAECQRLGWADHKRYCTFQRLLKLAFEERLDT